MPILKNLFIISILFLTQASYAQNTYNVKSYEECKVKSTGEKYNCKSAKGTHLFEYFKVDIFKNIEFKNVTNEKIYNIKWDNKKLIKHANIYTYNLISEFNAQNKTYFSVILAFDLQFKTLIQVQYDVVIDNTKTTCTLYF